MPSQDSRKFQIYFEVINCFFVFLQQTSSAKSSTANSTNSVPISLAAAASMLASASPKSSTSTPSPANPMQENLFSPSNVIVAQAIAHQLMLEQQQQNNQQQQVVNSQQQSQFQNSPQTSQPMNLYESLAAAAAYSNSLQMHSTFRDLIANAAYSKLLDANSGADCDSEDFRRKKSTPEEQSQYPMDLSSPPPPPSPQSNGGQSNQTRQSVIKSNGLKKSFSPFSSQLHQSPSQHSDQSNGAQQHYKQRMSGESLILHTRFLIVFVNNRPFVLRFRSHDSLL